MCRFGCGDYTQTYMCKWCGTRFCKNCLGGEFQHAGAKMVEAQTCRMCNQTRCQGKRVEFFNFTEADWAAMKGSKKGTKKGSKSAGGKKKSGKKKKK